MMYDINTYVDRIFYINMDKDVERNNRIIKEFERNGITNYERISGVVINEIPERHGILGPFKENQDRERYIKGSIGCLLSHKQAIETAKQRGYQRICVLEDDVFFIDNFATRFDEFVRELEKKATYQLAYIGLADEVEIRSNDIIKELESHCYGAFAYILNDGGWTFDFVLANIDYVFEEIDLLYNAMVVGKAFTNCYLSTPKLVLHSDPNDSNIQNRN